MIKAWRILSHELVVDINGTFMSFDRLGELPQPTLCFAKARVRLGENKAIRTVVRVLRHQFLREPRSPSRSTPTLLESPQACSVIRPRSDIPPPTHSDDEHGLDPSPPVTCGSPVRLCCAPSDSFIEPISEVIFPDATKCIGQVVLQRLIIASLCDELLVVFQSRFEQILAQRLQRRSV